MFISVIYGDNKVFLANTNCPVLLLMNYLKNKLDLTKSDTIDLCNEAGILKLLFLAKDPLENASRFFTPRGTYYICKIQRGETGSTNENVYEAIYPILDNPDAELCEALKRQRAFLEKNRIKVAKTPEAKRTRSSEIVGPVVSATSQPWNKESGRTKGHDLKTQGGRPWNNVKNYIATTETFKALPQKEVETKTQMKTSGKAGAGSTPEVPLKKSDSKGTKIKAETGRKERHK